MMMLGQKGMSVAVKAWLRKDTPPGMCRGQAMKQGLHHQVTEVHLIMPLQQT